MSGPADLFRAIVESSPDAFWVIDLEGRTIYANPQLAKLYGVPPTELGDLTVFDTLDADGRLTFAEHLLDLRAGRLNHDDVECLFVRKDGDTTWVLLRESPWLDEAGKLVGVVHRISEYAQRRAIHDELTQSRRRLAETQRIARVGGWDWDLLTNELIGTEALAGLYGMAVEDFPGDIDALFALAHPDDITTLVESMTPIGRGENSFGFVVRFRINSDVDWMWIRARGVVSRDAEGRALHVSGTHQDVTELMLAETALEDRVSQNELLRAVASAANRAGTLDEVLPHLRKLLLSHDDWIRARYFHFEGDLLTPHLIHPDDAATDAADPTMAAEDLDLATRAAGRGESLWSDDGLVLAAPVVIHGASLAVILIASNPPLQRLELIQESVESSAVQIAQVIEREEAARTLSTARDAAMDASRQKSEFLATMSHEIRTPLNGVIGLNDLLLRSDLDEAQNRLATGVQVAGRALLAVLNDVLDFSKIEAGKIDLESLDFDVRAVFEQVGGVLGETARSKGLELMLSCHPDVPAVINGDPTRLAQVLTNLTSNAVKFTPEGEVFVRATVLGSDEDGVVLAVEVADTGIGIDPAAVESLLEPFTQADSSTTRIYGGTGLGLAISKQIVEALGGNLSVAANPSGGSTFRFTAHFGSAGVGANASGDDEARSKLAGSKILIVDDNEHNRLILLEQVAHWGMDASDVDSAGAALELITAAREQGSAFDVVLLDYAMPERDGLQLANDISAANAAPPTLIMLTSITSVDRSRAREVGIVECLSKPVPVGILRSVLLRQHDTPGGTRPATPSVPVTSKSQHILVVEDNEVNQMVALGVLKSLGYDGEAVGDGAQAIERIERGGVQAVLMDVQMPVLDGYAATIALRRAGHHDLPIIAMTAAAVEGERDRCLSAGMDDYLTKPIDPSALGNTLEEWLTPPAAEAESEPDTEPEITGDPTPPIEGLDTGRLDMLRDLDPGDTTYLDRAIGNFIANSETALHSLGEAIETANADQVRAISHKLSGSASNLGVLAAAREARALEQLALAEYDASWGLCLDRLHLSVARGGTLLLTYQSTYSGDNGASERDIS